MSAAPDAAGHRAVLVRIVLVALLVFVLDLGTKLLVSRSMALGQVIEVIPGLLNLHYIKNSGAAFGIGTQWPEWARLPFFLAVFGVAAWVLYSFYRRCTPEQTWLKLSLGLVAGGAFGNMADRLVFHRVTDFIQLHVGEHDWPYFNVADAAITIGVALLFLEVWFLEGRTSAESRAASSEPAG
jgi:signal peptidase II